MNGNGYEEYSTKKLASEMRTLQILMAEFNGYFRWLFCGIQTLMLVILTFGICGTVWAEGPLQLHLGGTTFGVFCVLVVTLSNLGNVFAVSGEILDGWRMCRTDRSFISRFLRSTPPTRVFIGAYFYADKMPVLTCLGIVVQNSVTLLVGA